jgi:hypothetical protein
MQATTTNSEQIPEEYQQGNKSPRRIQRKRAKGWRMPPNTVYVGRPSKWANPFLVANYRYYKTDADPYCSTAVVRAKRNKQQAHRCAVDDFDFWLSQQPELVRQIKSELRGKNLACWCPPECPCHADVLLKIANSENNQCKQQSPK